jgi:AraC-like DNA-binding protein
MGLYSHAVRDFGAPFRLLDEAVFVVPPGRTLRLPRQEFKVIFVQSGGIGHELGGKPATDLREGDLLAVPAGVRHAYVNREPAPRRVHVVRLFLQPPPSRPVRGSLARGVARFLQNHAAAPIQLPGPPPPTVAAIMRDLREETEGRRPGYRLRVHSLGLALLVEIARLSGGPPRVSRPAVFPRQTVAAAVEFIQKHHADPQLRLGAIAWHVGKGEEHLARLFKRETGRTVFDHVRAVRLDHAKTLLQDPFLTLTQIASRCGFESLSHFSRSFKQLAGRPPGAYRAGLELRLQAGPEPKRSVDRVHPAKRAVPLVRRPL